VSAYVIANIEVTDPEHYPEYARQTPAVVERFGGRFLVKGGAYTELEGSWPNRRLVVIEFPDRATAERWYSSPEYQRLAKLRQQWARSELLVIDGA
jgi:uncharacterized protein (DUF1330 family)